MLVCNTMTHKGGRWTQPEGYTIIRTLQENLDEGSKGITPVQVTIHELSRMHETRSVYTCTALCSLAPPARAGMV